MPERASKGADPSRRQSLQPTRRLAEQYSALEATLCETALGRWFLAEYARRHRSPETQLLLDAIARLETAVLGPTRGSSDGSLFDELTQVQDVITGMRRDIAQLQPPPRQSGASDAIPDEFDEIAAASEATTCDILSAAEDIQEVAWTLRDKDLDAELCDRLDRRAIAIYTACSVQDNTNRQTKRAVEALRVVEQRLKVIVSSWGSPGASPITNAPPGPTHAAEFEDDGFTPQDPECPGTDHPEDSKAKPFERPAPLTFQELDAVKRSTLFG